jgi:TonB family protein
MRFSFALAAILLASPAISQTAPTRATGSASEKAEGLTLDDRPKFRVLYGIQVYRVGGEVSAPQRVSRWSPEGKSHQPAGTVVIWAIVDASGRVRHPRVVRRLEPELDQVALALVEKWKFEPAKKNGQNVAVEMNLEVKFE